MTKTEFKRLSTYDIAKNGVFRAEHEDLFHWRAGRQTRVTFNIFVKSSSGVEYPVGKIVRIASVAEAERGRARWQSFGLDRKHHIYRTRAKAVLTSFDACSFCAQLPKAFRA